MIAPIRTPFGRHSTAAEVVEGIDLSGKRAIVTGAASGIGIETARALASTGADTKLHSYVEHSFSPRPERPRVWASVLTTMFERNFV